MPTEGNPRKTVRIADDELRTWLEQKAKAERRTETDVILEALRLLQARESESVDDDEVRAELQRQVAGLVFDGLVPHVTNGSALVAQLMSRKGGGTNVTP